MAKTSQLLQQTQVVLSSGNKPYEQRSISKMAVGALVLSMALFAAPQMAQAQQYRGQSQYQQQNLQQRIPAQVVSVKKIRPSAYERQQERLRKRSRRTTERVVDRLIGGLISRNVDRDLRSTVNAFSDIATDMTGNRISQWRNNNQGQVNSSDSRVMVTVDVRLQGRAAQRFEIVQSAAVGVRKGDHVYLMPTTDGGVAIVPAGYDNNYRARMR